MTSPTFHCLIIIALFLCLHEIIQSIKWKSEDDTEVNEITPPQSARQKFNVEGEILATLREMNCIPESIPGDKGTDIQFAYQGENLLICTDGDYRIAKIVDPYWYEVNLDDIDKFAEVRKAINHVNKELVGTTLFYNINERDRKFHISSIDRIIVANNAVETEHSIRSALGGFFHAHRCLERELMRQNID